MDTRSEIREFLTSWRARISPEEVRLPAIAGRRRVPGLRRAEVALLAGVSVDYYTRLERGNVAGVSDGVLEALADALQLDRAERAHLRDLVQAARSGTRPPARPPDVPVRNTIQYLLDGIRGPAEVRNRRMDVLAANAANRTLNALAFESPQRPMNLARFFFRDPRARDFYIDWKDLAHATVALLRAESGRHPEDHGLSDLIAELMTHSATFRRGWASHAVRFYDLGMATPVRLRHPEVGELSLNFELLELVADPGLRIATYTADPGSASEEGLHVLARRTTARAA